MLRAWWLLVFAAVTAAPLRAATATPLTEADLKGKTLRELALMRATIQAKAGLVFVEWWPRVHAEKQPAYKPGRYDETRLSDDDRKDLATLARYSASIPRQELNDRWAALYRAHRYATVPGPHGLAFSNDGSNLVSFPGAEMFGRGPASVWDPETGERLAPVAWPPKLVTRGYFPSPFGPRLGTEAHPVRLLDARFVGRDLVIASEYHALIGSPRAPQPNRGLLIGPNWGPDGGRNSGPGAACIAPDGSVLLTLSTFELRSFDLRQGKLVDTLSITPDPKGLFVGETRCEFVTDSQALVSIENGGNSYLFDTKARSVAKLPVPRGISVLAPGGELLALFSAAREEKKSDLAIWNVRGTAKEIVRFPGTHSVSNAWFTPDRRRLLIASAGGSLALLEVQTKARVLWRGDATFVHPNPRTTRPDSMSDLFPSLVDDAREQLDRDTQPDIATDVAFSPDGTRAAIAWASGRLEMRDMHSGLRISDFRGHEPWSDDELWEASLLARRLGSKLDAEWPTPPYDLNPLDHLAALDQPLPEGALELLSRLDLRLLRSTIAARRGATFKSETLNRSFSGMAWYEPNPTYTPALLSAVDRANIRAVTRREAALGGPLTEAEAKKHTEFQIYSGTYDWQLLPQPPEPHRTGKW